jgi:hypothetical protein
VAWSACDGQATKRAPVASLPPAFGIAGIPGALVVWRPTQSLPDVLDSA